MLPTLRRCLRASLFSLCLPLTALAQNPDVTTLVVPAAAGGGADILARLLAQKLGPLLDTSVVVDNRPGANSAIGIAAVTRAKPDGTTLLLADRTTTIVNPLRLSKLPYDPAGLIPVTDVAQLDFLFVAGVAAPFSTWQEMLAYAKANPGKVSVGSSGVGSGAHLSLELLAREAGASFVHVPYKGMSPALQDVMGGVIDGLIAGPAVVMPQLDSGKIRLLAQGASQRSPQFPDTPTVAELGITKTILLPVTFTVFAPQGTPPATVARLQEALHQATRDPDTVQRFASMALTPLANTPAEVASDSARLSQQLDIVIRDVGLRE